MASINGVSLKNLKTFQDHEGVPISQGTIYIDGKKAGFWSQDSWGGPDVFQDCENEIMKRAKLFKEGCPEDSQFADNPDVFMYHLLNLVSDEKLWKKAVKKNFKSLAVCTDGFHCNSYMFPEHITEDELKTRYSDYYKNMLSDMFKNTVHHLYVINGKADLELIVNKDHPAPARMA